MPADKLKTPDKLTGLMNRVAFHEALDRITQNGGVHILLFFDLDRFKDVNDTMGHKIGDLLLIEVARRAEILLPDAESLARLGGDEFAAILPFSALSNPSAIGDAVVTAMCQPFYIDGKVIEVGASVGIAIGSAATDGAQELLRRADLAMYEAKAAATGACRVFDDALDDRQTMESSIRVELGRSMGGQDMALHYQPIFDARTGEISRAEALLRWESLAIGRISPATLIPIAEESGHIFDLTEWTLDTALKTINQLGDLPIAVNISPVYFKHADFLQRVFDRMLAARVRPELLTLELTEGVLISNMEAAREAIGRLRDVGVNVYLDDFGTGYSSLSYLQHFDLDGLKLDKSFLRDIGQKARSTQIIRTVIEFGHNLDMAVVVEGVESEWQMRLLQLVGCDYLQGYQLGVPMDLPSFIKHREQYQHVGHEGLVGFNTSNQDLPALARRLAR